LSTSNAGSSDQNLSKDDSDRDGDLDDEALRLRKRTKRGQDFTLRRAVVLLALLRSKHQQLKSAVNRSSQQAAAPRSTDHGGTAVSMSTISSAAFFQSSALRPSSLEHKLSRDQTIQPDLLHLEAFRDTSTCRMLCRLSLSDHQHVVVDCNDEWLKTVGRSREQVLGRRLSELYCPTSLHRFELKAQLALKHSVIVVRNLPWNETSLIVDLVAWIDRLPGHAQSPLQDPRACVPGAAAANKSGVTAEFNIARMSTSVGGTSLPLPIMPLDLQQEAIFLTVILLNSRPARHQVTPAPPVMPSRVVSSASLSANPLHFLALVASSALSPAPLPSASPSPPNQLSPRPLSMFSSFNDTLRRAFSASLVPLLSPRSTTVYPPFAVFMPMSLADDPDADIYVLPWILSDPCDRQAVEQSHAAHSHAASAFHSGMLRTLIGNTGAPIVGGAAPTELFTAKRRLLARLFPDLSSPGLNERLFSPCPSAASQTTTPA